MATKTDRILNQMKPKEIAIGSEIYLPNYSGLKGDRNYKFDTVPVGAMLIWPAGTVPTNYLYCEGQTLNRADYPELFAVIGTNWGSTNATNFKLPDTRNCFPVNAGSNFTMFTRDDSKVSGAGYASLTDSGHNHSTNESGTDLSGASPLTFSNYTGIDYANVSDNGHDHICVTPYFCIHFIIKYR
jgi:hypothetical protein